MRYELVEITSDGLVSHKVETAEQALSLWYALDGDVQTIRNENQQEIGLAELRVGPQPRRACPFQNDQTSNVASPSSKPMLKMSVAVVRKMLDAVAGSAP